MICVVEYREGEGRLAEENDLASISVRFGIDLIPN